MPDRANVRPLANLPASGNRRKTRVLRPLCGQTARVADLLILSLASLDPLLSLSGSAAIRSPFAVTRGMFPDMFLNMLLGVLCLIAWHLLLRLTGMYSPRRPRSLWDYGLRCAAGLNACTLVPALLGVVWHGAAGVWRPLAVFWATSLAGMTLVRWLLWSRWDRSGSGRQRERKLLIVGSGQRASEMCAQVVAGSPEGIYRLLGYLDSQPQDRCVPESLSLGRLADLEHVLLEHEVDEVVIALPMKTEYEAVGRVIATCQALGVQSQYFADLAS